MGAAAFVYGLHNALNWAWAWSLQTGNVFIQISIPTRLLVFEGIHLFFWILSAIGLLVLIVWGTIGRSRAQEALEDGVNPFWAPRFRFYALTFALGLFLTYFGIVFLFNASVSGDDTPSGFVAFVYLNYAGIVRRSIISIIALLILITGVSLSTFVSWKPGLGFDPRPSRTHFEDERPAPTTEPEPVAPKPKPTPVAAPTVARPKPTAALSKPAAPAKPRRVAAKPAAPAARRPRAPSTSRSS